MLYGNVISNPMDQQSLNAMVDYWISPNAVKKDFELPKGITVLIISLFY